MRTHGPTLGFVLLTRLGLFLPQVGTAKEAVTVLSHGRIWTGNPHQPWAEAIAFSDDGRILDVGADTAVLGKWRRSAQVRDLRGRTVIPGLIDSHMHMLYGAYAL